MILEKILYLLIEVNGFSKLLKNRWSIKSVHLQIDDISVEVVQKRIKNLNLRIYPMGKVRVSAPLRMDLEKIRAFVVSKLSWIKKHQQVIKSRVREVPFNYVSGESHYYLGKACLLRVHEINKPPVVVLSDNIIELFVRPVSNKNQRKVLLDKWYRARLKDLIPVLIAKWEKELNVNVLEFGVKRMKTKWGTCNISKKRIWLNLELAKRSFACLEYVVVHEMVHLLERNHNNNFKAYMTKFIPQWKYLKKELNRTPLTHID